MSQRQWNGSHQPEGGGRVGAVQKLFTQLQAAWVFPHWCSSTKSLTSWEIFLCYTSSLPVPFVFPSPGSASLWRRKSRALCSSHCSCPPCAAAVLLRCELTAVTCSRSDSLLGLFVKKLVRVCEIFVSEYLWEDFIKKYKTENRGEKLGQKGVRAGQKVKTSSPAITVKVSPLCLPLFSF